MKPVISRREFIAGAVGTVAVIAGATGRKDDYVAFGAANTPTYPKAVVFAPKNLRGYGVVSGVFRSGDGAKGPVSVTHILCESEDKALLTQAKYISDLSALQGVKQTQLNLGTGLIQAVATSSGGGVAACAVGSNVVILTAQEISDLERLCAVTLPHDLHAPNFAPRVKVPMYLDRFDRYGLLSYYGVLHTPPSHKATDPPYDFSKDFDFAAENGLGLIIWCGEGNYDTDEGSTNRSYWDWAADECRARGIPLHLNTSWGPALWLTNRYRDQMMQLMPEYDGSYYRVNDPYIGGQGTVSWNSTSAEDAEMGVLQQIVKDYVQSPNIVGWLEPHGETDSPPRSLLVEYGPVADVGFRRFLQERYANLSALNVSWYGDQSRISSWDDVTVPELASFLGWSDQAIDLTGIWRVLYYPPLTSESKIPLPGGGPIEQTISTTPAGWDQPALDDSSWGTLQIPSGQKVSFLPQSPMFARRKFKIPDGWLADGKRVWLYLWDLNGASSDLPISINGKPTQGFRLKANSGHWGVVEITSILTSGDNLIALGLPDGYLGYRCYLSTDEPVQYPMLGAERNAQWVDFMDWSRWTRGESIRRGAEMIRQVDPNRPINFMHPDSYSDSISQICSDYGGQFHNTGYMAAFWVDYNPMICRSAGRPATAEPGSSARTPAELKRFWGLWISEGLNAVHYFYQLGDIMWNPDVLATFLEYRSLYESIGRYHVPMAETAALYGVRSNALAGFPWGLDPKSNLQGGYFAWNTAHPLLNLCPRDGITELSFSNGNAEKYRLVVDTNTSIMDDNLLAQIENWVRAGGTFVTYVQTGRHTPTEVNSWPIARLTGYDVIAMTEYDENGAAKTSSAFTSAPGQSVLSASAWAPNVQASGMSLKKRDVSCKDLLLWSDGTVAAGLRQLGQGQVIHLGCHFEHLSDRAAAPNTEILFSQIVDYLKIERLPGKADKVVFRHFISNSGLYDIWVLYNDSDADVTTDLAFTRCTPTLAIDLKTGLSTPIIQTNGVAGIYGIDLSAFDTRLYLTSRADVTLSPLEWLGLQRDWWAGTKTPDANSLPTPSDDRRNSVELVADWAFKPVDGLTEDQVEALLADGVDDTDWERRRLNIWSLPNHPDVKRAILRKRFTVPSTWTTGQTFLSLYSSQGSPFLDQGRVYLDGIVIEDFNAPGIASVSMTDRLTPGSSHLLTVEIRGVGSLCGFVGNAWVYHMPDTVDKMDLSGTWDVTEDGIHQTGSVTLPGTFTGVFASRNAVVDADHADKNTLVYLDVQGPVYGVLVNGKLFARSAGTAGSTFALNISNAVIFGESNLFEIVSRHKDSVTKVNRIELRHYDRDVYP